MSRQVYTKEYFQNQIEQSQIRTAILETIPPGVYYHNLAIVLAGLLKWAIEENFKDEVFNKPVKKEAAQ